MPILGNPVNEDWNVSVHSSESIHSARQSPGNQSIENVVQVYQGSTRIPVARVSQSLLVSSTEHSLGDGINLIEHVYALLPT